MAKHYVVSGVPTMSNGNGGYAESGRKRTRDQVAAMNDRIRSDKIRKCRSDGQRVRQARERLYGKQSHLVTVSYLLGREPVA